MAMEPQQASPMSKTDGTNICYAEKLTKRSSNTVLRLVSFSV